MEQSFFLLYFAGLVKSPHSLKEINIYGDHVPQQKTANHSEIAIPLKTVKYKPPQSSVKKTQTFFFRSDLQKFDCINMETNQTNPYRITWQSC